MWSFKLREKRRLKVFENRVLRRIFRPKMDEVTREKKNYIIRNLLVIISNPHQNFSCELLKKNEMGTCRTYGGKRGSYWVLVRNLKATRPLGRHRCTWEDDIKMNLQELVCGGMNWIDFAQDKDS